MFSLLLKVTPLAKPIIIAILPVPEAKGRTFRKHDQLGYSVKHIQTSIKQWKLILKLLYLTFRKAHLLMQYNQGQKWR